MYCSRLCNHKAAWARRKHRWSELKKRKLSPEQIAASEKWAQEEAQSLSEASPACSELISFTARTEPVVIRHLVSVEHDGSATTYTHKPATLPSLWQRLRKRIGDVVATIKYLITTSIDEYP